MIAAYQARWTDLWRPFSFFGRLLRSSMLISIIGLLGLLLMLGLNIRQGRVSLLMAETLAPTADATHQVLLGMLRSEMTLRGWVTLQDEVFKAQRLAAWSQIIDPASELLTKISADSPNRIELQSVTGPLRELEEAQWWVEQLAGAPGNLPAHSRVERRIEPLLASLKLNLETVAEIERRSGNSAASAVEALKTEVSLALVQFQLRLHDMLEHGGHDPTRELRSAVSALASHIEEFGNIAWSSPLAQERYKEMQRDWGAISHELEDIIQIRDSNQWNLALLLLDTRTDPLSTLISDIAMQIDDSVRQSLTREAASAADLSRRNSLIALVVILILTTCATAVSWWLSKRLVRPVQQLADAADQLSKGGLNEDLPLPRTSELAELTASFNRMRAELTRTLTDLKHSNSELELFAYTVSHDLRAPLRAITGFSEALVEDYGDQLDGEAREYLGILNQSAQDMAQLIDAILWLSRSTRGEMLMENIDLSELASQVVTDLEQSEPDRTVQVEIQPGIMVEGDRRLLKVMLENLLGNAWKFTSKTPKPHIRFSGELDGEQVRCSLSDNGSGFDMAYADKLFKPFHRLHAESDFAGTGIGLSSVMRIINRHRGRIWAESTPGSGATFIFELKTGDRKND